MLAFLSFILSFSFFFFFFFFFVLSFLFLFPVSSCSALYFNHELCAQIRWLHGHGMTIRFDSIFIFSSFVPVAFISHHTVLYISHLFLSLYYNKLFSFLFFLSFPFWNKKVTFLGRSCYLLDCKYRAS